VTNERERAGGFNVNVRWLGNLSILAGCLAWFMLGLRFVAPGNWLTLQIVAVALAAMSFFLLGVIYQCSRHHSANVASLYMLAALCALPFSFFFGIRVVWFWQQINWSAVAWGLSYYAAIGLAGLLFLGGRQAVRRLVGQEPPERDRILPANSIGGRIFLVDHRSTLGISPPKR
jgi:archaellum biogenesis protein FlaJ (TadC family)